jgi:poly-gamma-glutamate synthesis protein (capsule biosynthesis protein)
VQCVTIAMAGDVLLHPQLIAQARADAGDDTDSTVDGMDFFPMLAAQQRYVAGADIGICHLETPLADPAGPFENYPAFSVPPQVLPALTRTGFDACSTASNHTIDQGTTGLNRTLDDLDAAGILHDGSYRSQADSRVPVVINTPHGRVGFISVAYGFNGNEPDEPWQVGTIDIDAIKARAHLARAAGADLVVVAMHAGEEYDHTPNPEQKDTAKVLLADPDIDLVYGHHAHVVQPMEKINGKWAIYGLGNDIAAQLGSAPGGAAGAARAGPVQPGRGRQLDHQRRRLGRVLPGPGRTVPLVRADLDGYLRHRGRDRAGRNHPGGEPVGRRHRRRPPPGLVNGHPTPPISARTRRRA